MALKSTLKLADRKTRIFISYSRKDIDFANLLCTQLLESGYQVLLDKTDIAPGEPWQERLSNLIKDADAIIFSVSPHSAASTVCQWEVNESSRLGKRILPVVIDPIETGALPEALTKLNFIFFADQSFDEAFAKLKSALDTDLLWVRQHTRLGELALEWQANRNSNSRLLGSAALAQAENWIARQPDGASQPTDLQRQYIAASRRGVNFFQRLMLGGALTTAALAIGLVIWGYINKLEADDQRSKIQNTLDTIAIDTEDLALTLSQKFKEAKNLSPEIRIEVLKDALKIQQHLLDSAGSTPGLLVAKSETLSELSNALRDKGDIQPALDTATESSLIMESLVNDSPKNEDFKRNLSIAYNVQGAAHLELEDYQAALKSYERDLGVSRDLLKAVVDDPARKDDLAARKDDVAVSERQVGIVDLKLDSFPEARAHLGEAQKIWAELAKLPSGETKWQLKLAIIYGFLAKVDEREEIWPSAIANQTEGLTLLEKLQPDDPDVQSAILNAERSLGKDYAASGKRAKGLDHLMRALAAAQKQVDDNPNSLASMSELSVSTNLIGNFYFDDRNITEAKKYYADDLKLAHDILETDKGNAAYQLGLAQSMLNAAHVDLDTRQNLNDALGIMKTIESERDLNPSEDEFKKTLESEIAALPSK
jgi:tetratricopeptide (TPR) repeat protein